jgi:Galactocerebrosidase, C-terminal lectin domain
VSPIVRILSAAFAACGTLGPGSPALAETGALMIAIDRMTVGSTPEGFTFARTGQGGPAQWSVAADSSASAGKVIEQVSTDRTDYRFPLAVHDATSAANVEVVVRFKAVAGKVDQAAGIALRLRDADNYYVARANALEDNVRFYRVAKGRREQLEGANLKVSANEWHSLGLRAEGDRFTVSYDGKILFTATDKTFGEAGKVALWTKSDSVTRFDQISITTLP